MKKLIILFWLLLLLTSCYSNPQDTKKIEELNNKISEQEEQISKNNGIILDILKWNWSNPDNWSRNIVFYLDYTHQFSESNSKVLGWEYEIHWNTIILKHRDYNIELELNWWDGDDTNFYLQNDDWEYFIKN